MEEIQKANPHRNHVGQFTIEGKAVPLKVYREFIQELYDKYGNVPLGSVLAHYESLKDQPQSQPPADTISSMAETPLDNLFKADIINNDNMYIMQFFDDSSVLKTFQDYLKEQQNYPWIQWEDPSEFHVTLLAVLNPDPKSVASIISLLDECIPVTITFDGVGVFANEDTNVLFLNVKRTPELVILQSKLYDLVRAHVETVSPLTTPSEWQPHITLAYSEEPFDEEALKSLPIGGMSISECDTVVSYKGNKYKITPASA